MFIYLVRHGESESSRRSGWGDNRLTPDGCQQAYNLRELILKKKNALDIGKIYSSDLQRSIETASPTAEALHINITRCPDFRAPDNGVLANMPSEEADIRFPGLHYYSLDFDQKYPGGESPHEFYDRIIVAWKKFVKMVLPDRQNAILFSHSSVIRVVYCFVENLPYNNKDKGKIPEAELLAIELFDEDNLRCLFKL